LCIVYVDIIVVGLGMFFSVLFAVRGSSMSVEIAVFESQRVVSTIFRTMSPQTLDFPLVEIVLALRIYFPTFPQWQSTTQ
jgi:hypothetical protein